MKGTLGLLMILLCWNTILAQPAGDAPRASLRGVVVEKETRQTLIGAYVRLSELGRITATDETGRFAFPDMPAGSYTLEVSYTGKATLKREVRLEGPEEVELALKDAQYALDAVVVQSEREATLGLSRLRAVEGVAIYEGKKTEVVMLQDMAANLAANNPRQVYARVAGLNIWESDGAGLQLGIGGRGLSPNRTSNFNTRQNGYDISADALGYPESYYTPPTEALSSIQVVRGAASLQYGTQFGGMLNFVFKKPPRDKPVEVTTRQTVGSFGFFNSFNSLGGTVANGKLSYYGFYQYKRGDGWRPNAGFELHNGYVAVDYQPTDRLRVGLEWTRMHYLAQQPGGLTDAFFEQDARQSLRARNWFEVDWNLLALTLDYRLTDRTRINVRNFGLAAGRRALGNLAPINMIDLGGPRDLIDGRFRNFGNETRLLHRYRIGAQEHTFVAGVRLYRGRTTARQGTGADGDGPDFAFRNPENVEKSDYLFRNENIAAFAEHIFYLTPRFSLTPGIRFEHIRTVADGYFQQQDYDAAGNLIVENREEEATERPRQFVLFGLGASFKVSPRLELYGNLSQNYRAINFSDLRIDNPNFRVDPNITDERGYTADLGLRSRIADWFYADLTAFYIAYRDRIGLVLRANEPPLYNDYRLRTNIADARNIGIESFVEADLWRLLHPADTSLRLSLFLNASVVDARYINTDDRSIRDRQVELVPPVTLRTGLTLRRGPFRFSASWAYTHAHYTDATNAERTASAVNGLIPTYTVADASAAYSWRRWALEVSGNNLFDARYFTRRAEGYPGPGIIPADGRSWFVTLGFQL